jgi:hypothetical protein
MAIEIGRLHVRRSGLIESTPERVWQEFESSDDDRLGPMGQDSLSTTSVGLTLTFSLLVPRLLVRRDPV